MKILVIFSSALGDFINFLPFVHHLNLNYSSSSIHLITKKYYFPIIKKSYCKIEKLIDIEMINLFKLYGKNKNFYQDLSFFSNYDMIISFTGAKSKIFKKNLINLNKNSYFIFPVKQHGDIHESFFLINQFNFKRKILIKPKIKINKKNPEYILIHPGSGNKLKNVSLEFFKKISKMLNFPVKFFGGENEFNLRKKIDIEITKDLNEVFKLFEKAFFYIGNDSGVSHLAAACNILTFVFFGPTSFKVWRPLGENVIIFTKNLLCSPCNLNCNKNFLCLNFAPNEIAKIINRSYLLYNPKNSASPSI